jgi:CYTH domain-containing protein
MYAMKKWWEQTWQQQNKEYISLQRNYTETQNGNTTRVSVCTQTQHPLHKKPSFKAKLSTSEDQNHNMKCLHNVKRTTLGHELCIIHIVTNLDHCFESLLSKVYTSFVEL